jgi:hypothetical protein
MASLLFFLRFALFTLENLLPARFPSEKQTGQESLTLDYLFHPLDNPGIMDNLPRSPRRRQCLVEYKVAP